MGFNDERYFYYGGGIAFGFFAFLIVLIGYTLASSTKIEQFALTQSQYVSISLDMIPPKKSPSKVEQKVEEPMPVVEPTPVMEAQPQENQPQSIPDISDLFSNVKAEKIPKKTDDSVKKLEALNKLEQQIKNRAQNTPQLAEKVKNTALVKPSITIVSNSGSSGPLVNEYHAKIQALIYANYFPPSGTQGQKSRVRINLDASGRLTAYRVLSYSGNPAFNSEVDWLKDRLHNVVFPPHPDGKDTVLEIILTAKE